MRRILSTLLAAHDARRRPWASSFVLALGLLASLATCAAAAGRIQGRVVATDTGEPLGFADVLLVPADTTMKKVGGLTQADGTFLLQVPAGRYTLQIRALSYGTKRIEGIIISEGALLPFSTGLAPEAIQQEEVVVEAQAKQNTEASLLAARKKAPAVGDAVSIEQVRKSPDKNAAEVLRRVTGLSVSNDKYVFVRGMGERYSSTEVDGVRIASPEQNKRVVPLDLLPSNLLEAVVVQKTYTADRPGEFGGGDVQVRTKDFPGKLTWSFDVAQGYVEGSTFENRRTYAGNRADVLGFGSAGRDIPDDIAGAQLPTWSPSNLGTLASIAKSFDSVWQPNGMGTIPNAAYSATFGNEYRMFGRSLGVIVSGTLSRSYDYQRELQRFYQGSFQGGTDGLLYEYNVDRWTETVQLGGISGLSYRFSPRHTVHLRGFLSNNADDEVRIYQGPDYNYTEPMTNTALVHRNTRFKYMQRSVLSGSLQGQHELQRLLNSTFDWKISRSGARAQQPDRRELTYDRRYWYEGDTAHWVLGSIGRREYGDLKDRGWGATASAAVPYRLGGLGKGKVVLGYDQQTKQRENFYRRFNFYPNENANREDQADSIFAEDQFDGAPGSGYVEEATINDPVIGVDNYRAEQRVTSGFVSVDVPLGRRLRANVGVRAEHGYQDVESYALFNPGTVLAHGEIDGTDLLPSANVTWSITDAVNLRAAASRTLSRPDLNELSPSPNLEYIGGMMYKGNPGLERATIDNYDLRFEAFPGLSEVVAAGVFYKRLHQPIEMVIHGGTPLIITPDNSASGENVGVELEYRSGLGRLWKPLQRLSVNSNASFIRSEVKLAPTISKIGSQVHPLQGQADYLLNAALTYATPNNGLDASVLYALTGKRLAALGSQAVPDIYYRPLGTLDATMSFGIHGARLKLAARNLLDARIERIQGNTIESAWDDGRSYSVRFSYGS